MKPHLAATYFATARERVKEHRERIYAQYSVGVDPWLARDKLEHLVVCWLITIVVYVACAQVRRRPSFPLRLLLAVGASSLVGVAKEVGDAAGMWPWCPPCSASRRDLVADGLGAALGVVLIVCVTCCKFIGYLAVGYRTVAPAAPASPPAEDNGQGDLESGAAAGSTSDGKIEHRCKNKRGE